MEATTRIELLLKNKDGRALWVMKTTATFRRLGLRTCEQVLENIFEINERLESIGVEKLTNKMLDSIVFAGMQMARGKMRSLNSYMMDSSK